MTDILRGARAARLNRGPGPYWDVGGPASGWVRFFAAHPQDAAWIAEHAADGDAVALALAGLEAR